MTFLKKNITGLLVGMLSLFSTSVYAQQQWGPLNFIEPLPTNGGGTGGNVGTYASMHVVNGFPAMSYYDGMRNNLLYVRATNANGTAWGTPVIAAGNGTGKAGYSSCLRIVNGNPAIAYYDLTHGEVRYTRATDASGTSWGTPVTVASQLSTTAGAGPAISMEVINGKPALAYYDNVDMDLKYISATDINGDTWGTALTLDANYNAGTSISMQTVNGKPAVAYLYAGGGILRYIRSSDAAGTTWGTAVNVINNVGQYPSLVVVNGNPAIACQDYLNGDLVFIRATDADGTAWGSPVIADATASATVGLYNSMQVVNGNPAIAYHDLTNRTLKYVSATNASGTAWSTAITVDGSGSNGTYATMQVVNGNPAVAYLDASNAYLKYIRANDASGATWGTISTIDGAAATSVNIISRVVNGNPAVSYIDGNTRLTYARANDATGTTWAAPITLHASDRTAGRNSLQIVNGNPAIAYCETGSGDLKYIRATNASGTTWGSAIIIDAAGSTGANPCLEIANGNPAIIYYDITNRDIRYVRATDANGTTWATPITVVSTGDIGSPLYAQIVNGNPAVAYYDATNQDLVYVRANDASGTTWGTPITIASAGSVGTRLFMQIINGNPAIAYYDATNTLFKFVRASDASGSAWATPVTVPATASSNLGLSMQNINGKATISYSLGNILYCIRAKDAEGTKWGTPVAISEGGVFNTLMPIGARNAGLAYNTTEGLPGFHYGFINDEPSVNITSPIVSDVFYGPATISIAATATDADGTVSKVEFYQGAVKLGEDASLPYTFNWTGVAAGNYNLTAVAIDNENGTTTSSVVTITVQTNLAPTVSITSPANNTTFISPTTVSITATAADADDAVAKVEFYQGVVKIGEDLSSPYTLDWSGMANGTYTLTAVATDGRSGSTTSAPISITIKDPNVAPTVSITSPVDGSTFTEPSDITVTVTAADADGNITKVEFYVGIDKVGEDASSPYTFDWENVNEGTYDLTAVAIDNESLSTTSQVITVTVDAVTGVHTFLAEEIVLYPNPVSSYLHIKTDSDLSGTTIKIIDVYGRAIHEQAYDSSLPLSNIASGMYTIVISTADGNSFSTVFVKQ